MTAVCPEGLLGFTLDQRHTRVSKLRVGDGTAI